METVKVLIDKGANVRIPRKSDKKTPLHAAVQTGKKGLLEYMVRQQPPGTWKSLINTSNTKGETVLHCAIIGGDLDAVRFALFAGADSRLNGYFSSPLHYAIYSGQKGMIRPLLEKFRDANPRDEDGDTPLHLAVHDARFDIVQELIQVCEKEKLTLDIDAVNKFSNTALHYAV